ncbi:MAG: helix-turn-helix transcriptional regulator [Lachnospiraceae bacterium]|jgi:transcriptional regulator with XRE-family HTH domain|nr:helix-turn-helix transcriptional regulator [Lachnospiraceae bacterium]
MMIHPEKVGKQILFLRKRKNITQNELGERLGVSFQAVCKWERGETLPDTALLADLANVLETTIDHILLGGDRLLDFKCRVTLPQIREGIECFVKLGELLGKDNLFYIGAIEGVDRKDLSDIQKGFTHAHWIRIVTEYAQKHGIR